MTVPLSLCVRVRVSPCVCACADTSRLLTCGKDNRTLLWDLQLGKVVHEVDTESADGRGKGGVLGNAAGGGGGGGDGPTNVTGVASGPTSGTGAHAASFFGGAPGAGAVAIGSGRSHTVAWSPCVPAVMATCSLDRRVRVHNLMGVGSEAGNAPAILKRPTGASFGFGGKLVTYGSKDEASPSHVSISRIEESGGAKAGAEALQNALADGDMLELCAAKVSAHPFLPPC